MSWKSSLLRLVFDLTVAATMRNVFLPRSTETSPPRSTSSSASDRWARS